ncbi:hypothetical protein GQ457_07G014970 [Hibiscus cannabinus]
MGCGFCESALSNSVGTLVVDCVVKPVGRQLDYVRFFHDNVEELKERRGALERARARLQHEVESAVGHLLQIEDDVQSLQSKADATLLNVETLENEIQQNKRCLKWCPNWSWRYQLSKKAKKKTMDISALLEKINKIGQPGRVGYHTLPTIQFLCSKDFVVSKSSKTAFNQIVQALKDDNISMIGLLGMGGVGKTTLVHEVGKHVQAQNPKLFDKVTEQGRRSEQELWLRLKKEERILIVLDDVWTYFNLKEKIGIPVGEDSFNNTPWTSLSDSSDDAIQNLAKEIIKKCQGLPIAIVTLGSALEGKSYHGWEVAYRRLKNRRLTEIEDVNEENAYLCLEKIYVEDLVRFSWGLKLYKNTDSINEVRNEVLAAIEILKNSCLLLDCGEMHDMVREVALWIASSRKDISFAIKSEATETLPMDESLKHFTAIFFKTNQTRELPKSAYALTSCLRIEKSVDACKQLLEDVESLELQKVMGHQNLVPCLDFGQGGFNKLTSLRLVEIDAYRNERNEAKKQHDELRVIWNVSIQVENFQNLTALSVDRCKKVRYIFSPTMARTLPQLSSLYIDHCKELEQIIVKDQTSSQEVFEGDEGNEEEKVIHLPRFKYLQLHRLPNCASFSPVGYHFAFPSLKEIEVRSCPNITTSFSVDSKLSVHAKTQASQSIDEITVQESASAQETTWPLGSDIRWQRKWEAR